MQISTATANRIRRQQRGHINKSPAGKRRRNVRFANDYNTALVPVAIANADFNGDGKLDLVTANNSSDTVSVLLSNGDGTLGSHKEYPTASFPSGVAVPT